MADRRDTNSLISSSIRIPADLIAILVLVVVTAIVIWVPVINETPLRVVVSLSFLLFGPGYALIAAVFPESGGMQSVKESSQQRSEDGFSRQGIDGLERAALSFGLSIAVVPLVGLGLTLTRWGVQLAPVVFALSTFTLAFVLIATYRRQQLPPDERFHVPFWEWIARGRSELLDAETTSDKVLNGLLVASILLATISVGFVTLVPQQGEGFSELYVLNEGEDGQLQAKNHPANFTVGESTSMVVGIGNNEHKSMEYTVVVSQQRVERANSSIRVIEETELKRVEANVQDNSTWQQPVEIQPSMTGQKMRLSFLLYRGEPPTNPSVANAYQDNHLIVNVTD